MYAGTHTSRLDRAAALRPSFRKSSTAAALYGTAGRGPWRIWEWLAPMPCSRELRRARMPMPLGSERSRPWGFPQSLERRRPQHPPAEASQDRVREAKVIASRFALALYKVPSLRGMWFRNVFGH